MVALRRHYDHLGSLSGGATRMSAVSLTFQSAPPDHQVSDFGRVTVAAVSRTERRHIVAPISQGTNSAPP
jgi:hypothetical protein